MSESLIKVTLGSKKVVVLREMKIKHTELAAQAAASKAGDNQAILNMLMQKELIKILLVSVDGKPLSGAAREDLDDIFSVKEYAQLVMKVNELNGGADEMGKATHEVVFSGDK